MGFLIFIIIVQAIVCGALSAFVADEKGYSSGSWFACGLFLGIFGLIAVAGLPRKQASPPQASLKKCLDCAEHVAEEALVCKHCGYRFFDDLAAARKVVEEHREAAVRPTKDVETAFDFPNPGPELSLDQWYYKDGADSRGPVSVVTLQGLYIKGEINDQTVVWTKTGVASYIKKSQISVYFKRK